MKTSKIDPDRFPRTLEWCRTELPKIPATKGQVWEAFCKFGQISVSVALDVFRNPMHGPLLIVDDNLLAYGQFRPEERDRIRLGGQFVALPYEQDSNDVDARQLLERTILHEAIHWADFRKNGYDFNASNGDDDQGKQFERAAYAAALVVPAASPVTLDRDLGYVRPSEFGGVMLARPDRRARYWPLATKHPERSVVSYKRIDGKTVGNASRAFGATRAGGARRHAGIDLYGNENDPVIACEDGVIVQSYQFTGKTGGLNETHALIVQCDSGLVINYGEVKGDSIAALGMTPGRRIHGGDTIARLAKVSTQAMLHFEIYTRDTVKNYQWRFGRKAPARLLNPSLYLLQALQSEVEKRRLRA
ncbi:MAG: peptidoglycan DD-metalloendopeptidase family protein [Pseudomonadota bacterium]